ncbi:hypothetical protein GU254_15770 [Vibrio cholerae]|uniref:hypothetical protein n=1 Tax=Vibrio TaxID=662 RepID=UPI000D3607EE|nr:MULTISPECIES: hypothetical protein [Vibrio]MBN7280189.1 hypothetical protein [Vibrio paracholerae]MBN7281407.1 hypothetical protein [Vibrio paracholerae]PUA69950.1 hypothetical protein DB317_17940 [Vibrio cholerae]
MSDKLEQCLKDYYDYHHSILLPTLYEIDEKVSSNALKLHQAIGFNMVIAHALDYMLAIQKERTDDQVSRKSIMQKLDIGYHIEGGRFTNSKFQLIDAVNNSMKHITLDPDRYKKLIDEYGHMSFRLLVEDAGVVYMKTERYQFDYGRIVLRSISKILGFSYNAVDYILSTIDGEAGHIDTYDPYLDSSDPSTAIDRMIEYCNPTCVDCDEGENECTCEEFKYGDLLGEFSPDIDHDFDVESTMAEIGSSWK